MQTITLKIEGMTCQHCVKSVNKALSEIKGVKSVLISLETKQAAVSFEDDIKKEDLIKAVDEIGFKAS